MTRYVIDASVAVEYLLRTPLGLAAAGILDNASLVAPELMDAEVLSVLRRAVLNGRLDEVRAKMAVDDLAHWPVDRISHISLSPWLGNITGTSVPMMPFTGPPPAPTAYH